MSDSSKVNFVAVLTGKNGKVPHTANYTYAVSTPRMDYFNLQSGVKKIEKIEIKHNGKIVAVITPKDFTKTSGSWVVENCEGLTQVDRALPKASGKKIDMRLDVKKVLTSVFAHIEPSFKASREFGGTVGDDNKTKIVEMRKLGLTDAQIAKFLDLKVANVAKV